ncbi:MAG: serine protein kinase PrkA [Candidatus Aminicenantes bacterium]|nr:serine protein kinase PrkA [Candidatus Aminicenantes bacterium]NIM83821.1 serine protein kinase PrkA [Candidatus Aminicenantes bacterium]NIN23271.1 serine protein kinase PrkA [Candidatus Aminicenantes bacterium]NIN46975.1 serine protein kinase PrkA [Candidatus Aminicenantes bacterium]NIN89897.1 serine protein kinase PrkA [Candidatus Aminicenantes bacterium]
MKENQKRVFNLQEHLTDIKKGKKRFENAFEGVTRMILEQNIEKVVVNGKTTYDFKIFRTGKKHIIGLYDEINSFVSYVKDAAEGGSSKEMAYVLVGEPGNGKTFFVEYLCSKYRQFLANDGNRKYTFRFKHLDQLGNYGRITTIESQTYEDPVILAINLLENQDENKKLLGKWIGFSDKQIEKLYEDDRPLGACSEYIWYDILNHTSGTIKEALNFIEVVPVPLMESLGTITGKYPAKDKITSSAVDLLGEESIQRLLHITDPNNPYRFDLRRGALARVAGSGIHFCDEIFKNKKDLVQVYLGVIQNRVIEIDGFKWPIDTLIIATSNNSEFNRFLDEKEEAPIVDRCRVTYVSHNTNYRLQVDLTDYAIGSEAKTTFSKEELHEDPNLNYAASAAVVLTRLPKSEKLTPIETMKLAAGEVAGEKSIKTLAEVIDTLNQEPDITKRFGQKGLGQRNLGRAIQLLVESSETNEGKCMFAYDTYKALERIVLDYVTDANDRAKYLEDLKIAKGLYRERIMTEMFNAYMDEPYAIRKDVMNYVNMIIGIDAENLGPDKMWKYKDPQSGELRALKIDEKYINSVEERLGLKTHEQRENFRTSIRKIYGQKISTDPNYDFMDNLELVKAVTDVRLKSDIAGSGSLIGALANRTNEENQKLYDRMIDTMLNKLNYCRTCAQKTIEYFCTQTDEK